MAEANYHATIWLSESLKMNNLVYLGISILDIS